MGNLYLYIKNLIMTNFILKLTLQLSDILEFFALKYSRNIHYLNTTETTQSEIRKRLGQLETPSVREKKDLTKHNLFQFVREILFVCFVFLLLFFFFATEARGFTLFYSCLISNGQYHKEYI